MNLLPNTRDTTQFKKIKKIKKDKDKDKKDKNKKDKDKKDKVTIIQKQSSTNTLTTFSSTIKCMINSILLNYKSWFFIISSVSYLSYPNILSGILTFIILLLIVHLFHYGSHLEFNYPFNIIHT